MQAGWRPPGAIFFLHRRRKNMERKTPRRAGCSPPYEPTPLGGCRWCGWVSFDYQANLPVLPCPDSWCAGRLPLRCSLRTAVVAWGIFFGAGSRCVFNFFQASGLAPSGGHILSSPAKKEYGKKDAAQGGGAPPYVPTPLGGGREYSRTLYQLPGRFVTASVVRPGEQTACRCACAYDAGC